MCHKDGGNKKKVTNGNVSEVTLTCPTCPTCPLPYGYTVASSNARKAYKMAGSTGSQVDAVAMCKADAAWLVMPKSSDDLADIQSYNCKNTLFVFCVIKFHRRQASITLYK